MTDTITKQEPKLSVRKPGYWRNKWLVAPRYRVVFQNECDADGILLHPERYVSREIAEEKATAFLRRFPGATAIRFVGPVFFPEGDEQ